MKQMTSTRERNVFRSVKCQTRNQSEKRFSVGSQVRILPAEVHCKANLGSSETSSSYDDEVVEKFWKSNYFAQFLFSIDSDCVRVLFVALIIICGLLAMTLPI